MDPVTLATATAALTVLGTEVAKGIAGRAAEDTWSGIKRLFGWSAEPQPSELPHAIATELNSNDALLNQVANLLQQMNAEDSPVQMIGTLVGNLKAEKAIVAQKIEGGITM